MSQNPPKSTKLYSTTWLSLPQNSDLSHQKMWNSKNQQTKHIQQQKQIDRILYGIVKERLFGNLLAQDTRISGAGYYALDKINREMLHPLKNRNSRKIQPIRNQPLYQLGSRSRMKHRTIDAASMKYTPQSMLSSYNDLQPEFQQLRSSQKRTLKSIIQMNSKTKKLFYQPKLLQTSKLVNMQAHFRELVASQAPFYQLKINKEMLLKYNKAKGIISNRCLERFLFFFNFNGPFNYKQYCSWVEQVANCTITQGNFFVFQVLEQSRNGILTISDLFRALQDFPLTSSSEVQRQIYQILQKLNNLPNQSSQIQMETIEKPSLEQIIITNHNLKIEQMRQLVKQSSKQLIQTNCVKSTSYHNSMYALQHNSSAREKNMQLEQSQRHKNLKDEGFAVSNQNMTKMGLKFGEFDAMFSKKRSQVFCLTLRLLIGEDAIHYQ